MLVTQRERQIAALRARLTPRQRIFADALAEGQSRADAARAAGYTNAPSSVRVDEYLALLIGEIADPPAQIDMPEIRPERVLAEVADIAYDRDEATKDRLVALKLLMGYLGLLQPEPDQGQDQGPVQFHLHLHGGEEPAPGPEVIDVTPG